MVSGGFLLFIFQDCTRVLGGFLFFYSQDFIIVVVVVAEEGRETVQQKSDDVSFAEFRFCVVKYNVDDDHDSGMAIVDDDGMKSVEFSTIRQVNKEGYDCYPGHCVEGGLGNYCESVDSCQGTFLGPILDVEVGEGQHSKR